MKKTTILKTLLTNRSLTIEDIRQCERRLQSWSSLAQAFSVRQLSIDYLENLLTVEYHGHRREHILNRLVSRIGRTSTRMLLKTLNLKQPKHDVGKRRRSSSDEIRKETGIHGTEVFVAGEALVSGQDTVPAVSGKGGVHRVQEAWRKTNRSTDAGNKSAKGTRSRSPRD